MTVAVDNLGTNVNTSSPLGGTGKTGWQVYINNASGSSTNFDIEAECAKAPKSYTIVSSADIDNPAGTQTKDIVATCPTDAKVLGGGGVLESADTSVNLNDSFPIKVKAGRVTHYGWRIDANNASSGDNRGAIAYAICGKKVAGYKLVQGATVTNPALSLTGAKVNCPLANGVQTVAMGGGVASNSGSTLANLATGYTVTGSDWEVIENNGSTVSSVITPYVTCAL
jgi:hypothetical protein